MAISIHTAKYYLERWGAYMRADRLAGLGYPSVDIAYKMAVGSGDVVEASEPEGVRIMQSIYVDMTDDYREVIDIKYKDDKTLREAADILGISYRRYRNLLNEATEWVRRELNNYPA